MSESEKRAAIAARLAFHRGEARRLAAALRKYDAFAEFIVDSPALADGTQPAEAEPTAAPQPRPRRARDEVQA